MLTGSIVAMVTPMLADSREVDWDALKSLTQWHVAQGTAAIVAVGTTGESATLDVQEHLATVAAVVEHVAGKIPVIAGTGANNTREAIELTAGAKNAGADACLIVTPYYNKPPQEGLYQHHKAIAEAVDIPQILYNVPGRTACDMLPETVARLAVIPNIVGIKEATGDLQRAKDLLSLCPADFAIYSGDDFTAVELMLLGGHGDISVTANVVPQMVSQVCALALAGNAEEARALDARLQPLHEVMFLEANPIPVKWALAEMEKIQPAIRLPLVELSVEHQQTVRDTLASFALVS